MWEDCEQKHGKQNDEDFAPRMDSACFTDMGPGGEGWGPAFRSFPFGGTEPGEIAWITAVSCEPLTLSRLGTVPQTEQGSSYTDTLLPDT